MQIKLDRRNTVVLVLVFVAVGAWALRRLGMLYIPALTAFALAVAMGIVGVGFIRQKGASRKTAGVLILAFGLLNIIVGLAEIVSFTQGA